MTQVKICGIRDEFHALAAAEAGADFVGFVFAPSARQVDPNEARQMAEAANKSGCSVKTVGVFVNMPASQVNAIADFCPLDWVQLSGDENWQYCLEIKRPIIKAIRLGTQSADDICAELAHGAKVLATRPFLALLDSKVEDRYGGTGIPFDWRLAKLVATRFPVIVAGGLTPENVAGAIQMIGPWGVDVSSGVEFKGIKDIARIRAFIDAVRETDASGASVGQARQRLLPAETDYL